MNNVQDKVRSESRGIYLVASVLDITVARVHGREWEQIYTKEVTCKSPNSGQPATFSP